ncbi:murein transglycosylase A [Desulfopila sp. IMCC35008]|uniref:murein transglycosylase A n=1 Tax=Desulfopila sp. IMCC35008 TaxID=2653858 RepID=UPI0013D59068|nr:MltA domain-containing protein [Desulfopila sp. IMCC35008]
MSETLPLNRAKQNIRLMRRLVLALIVALVFSSCTRSPVRLLPEQDYPIFTDDYKRTSLLQVAESQLRYINSLPSDHTTSVLDKRFTKSQLADSLKLFIRIVRDTPGTLELNKQIKTSFHVFKASGKSDRWFGEMLATGYYEPLFEGSLYPDSTYRYPLYKRPRQLISRQENNTEGKNDTLVGRLDPEGQFIEFWSRSEIETKGYLRGQELVYLKNRFDAFLLHVQGSGRIRLPDETIQTVRFAGHNGHTYNSIGKLLVDENKMTLAEASVPAIRSYLDAYPEDIERVLHHNPRYIFFTWGDSSPPSGSMGVPLTAGRSIAIDRTTLPAELIGYLLTEKPQIDSDGTILKWVPLRRFVMPQDTGAAIKGPGRVDLFLGSGKYSEVAAGNMKQTANLFFLIAKD